MPILDEKTRNEVQKILGNLKKPVRLKLWTQPMECMACRQTHELLDEVVSLNDKLSLEVYPVEAVTAESKDKTEDKLPAIAVIGEKDHNIRFYGVPAGYEFSSLLNAILIVSTGVTKLLPETRHWLATLEKPLHLQVFVTPTCPYCPTAVMLAHQLAYASDQISAGMVELTEFPHLATKYGVQGVPSTVINETIYQEGAAPEAILVAKLKEAVR